MLDFSMHSLKEIDHIIDLPLFHKGRETQATEEQAQNESGLSAYIGETLLRLHAGEWRGTFCTKNPEINFYTSFIQFRRYRFWPSHALGYRLANGISEGSLSERIKQIAVDIERESALPQ